MSANAQLPNIMKVIEISQPGEPEVLKLAERPIPTLAPGEILVKVAASGVNRPDVMQRRGQYAPPPGASDIPGWRSQEKWLRWALACNAMHQAIGFVR